jgi:amidase
METRITAMSATEAARLMREGGLSPVDAVTACLARIDAANPKVNAVVTLDREGADRHAAEAAAAPPGGRGSVTPRGPLFGLPFTVKDNIETAGMRTTASHPPLCRNVPEHDATVVARLKAAGAVLMGKTNLPQLAMDFQTDSPLFGRANNPYDLARTTGGSSGGAAAAVASGMSFFDVGNDLLGSVRIPAGYCGVVGFVPSIGLVPRTGMIPQQPSSESVRQLPRLGFLTRTVADAALLSAVVSGPDGMDTCAVPVGEDFWGAAAGDASRPLTLLVSPDADGVPVSRDTASAFAAFVDAARRAGAVIRTLEKGEFDFNLARLAFLRIFYPAISVDMPPIVRFFARHIGKMPFMDSSLKRFLQAEKDRRDLIQRLDALLSGVDALLCPVTSTPAFPHVKPNRMNGPMPVYTGGIDVDGRKVDYGTATVGFTLPFSTTGSPVVALPIGSSATGLPIGAQVVGRRYADAALLRTAERLEAVAAPLIHNAEQVR